MQLFLRMNLGFTILAQETCERSACGTNAHDEVFCSDSGGHCIDVRNFWLGKRWLWGVECRPADCWKLGVASLFVVQPLILAPTGTIVGDPSRSKLEAELFTESTWVYTEFTLKCLLTTSIALY